MKATPRLKKLLDRFEEEIVAKAEKEKARLQVTAINLSFEVFFSLCDLFFKCTIVIQKSQKKCRNKFRTLS